MTVRLIPFIHATSDVVDEALLKEFPKMEPVRKSTILACSPRMRSTARKSSMSTIPPSRAEFAKLVRDKGRALQVDPVHDRRHRCRAESGAA